ncbi:lytic transglycosylase domain-containing protein [bacterium]|nr:lytic transglycosylase domain-containing protein [bacterium]
MNYPMMYMPMTMPMPITMPITPFMPSISSSTTITQSEGFDKPKKTELNFAAEQQIAADGSEKKDEIKVNKPKVEDKSNYKTNALPKISNSKLMSRVPAQRKAKILDCVNRACKQYNVDPKLVISLMFAESGFDPNATSRCGAAGLMQLMPATAKSYGASNPYDIEQNIFAGTKFLKYLLNRYNGNTDLAVAAYNAGPGRVHNTVPNIKETKNHVAKVNRNMASLA